MARWKICCSSAMIAQPTRRKGISERRLLTCADSHQQNIVLIEIEQGAEVEVHEVSNSESLFILEGEYEVLSSDTTETLYPGDLVHFPPRTFHGLRCAEGPGRFLAIFAPAKQAEN